VPATLVLFFIRDRLQAPAFEPLFLASYFAAGALSMPLWLRLVARFGLARTWLAGMALAVWGVYLARR
jgi:Na+/melibiose symporter-like transporter